MSSSSSDDESPEMSDDHQRAWRLIKCNDTREQGLQVFAKLVEEDDAEAMYVMGLLHSVGDYGVTADMPRSLELLRAAADKGLIAAQQTLAEHLFDQGGDDSVLEEAYKYLNLAYEQGSSKAGAIMVRMVLGDAGKFTPLQLGRVLQRDAASGEQAAGVAKKFTQEQVARMLQRDAALNGSVMTEYLLGICHERGFGVEQSMYRYVRHMQLAARGGHIDAIYRMGLCYRDGTEMEKSFDKAIAAFAIAEKGGHEDATAAKRVTHFMRENERAEGGCAEAQYAVGMCCMHGMGTEKNKVKALEWLRRAADQDHARAQMMLAKYTDNEGDVERLLTRAMDGGCCEATYELGMAYLHGDGFVTGDTTKSIGLLRKASDEGSLDAACVLGNIYRTGDFVGKDLESAETFLRKAAEGGQTKSMLLLGLLLEEEKDSDECVEWFKRVTESPRERRGIGQDYVALGMLKYGLIKYEGLHGEAVDYDTAFRMFADASTAGVKEACFALYECFLLGRGCVQDKEAAWFWCRDACEGGFSLACYDLFLHRALQEGGDEAENAKSVLRDSVFRGSARAKEILSEDERWHKLFLRVSFEPSVTDSVREEIESWLRGAIDGVSIEVHNTPAVMWKSFKGELCFHCKSDLPGDVVSTVTALHIQKVMADIPFDKDGFDLSFDLRSI